MFSMSSLRSLESGSRGCPLGCTRCVVCASRPIAVGRCWPEVLAFTTIRYVGSRVEEGFGGTSGLDR